MAEKRKSNRKVTEIPWTLTVDSLHPVSDIVLQRHANDLLAWANGNEDAIRLKTFMTDRHIAPKVFYEWADRYRPLKAAMEVALDIIGGRRELKGLQRKYDPNLVERTMPLYDSQYKAWKLEQKMNQQESQKPTEIRVIMQPLVSEDPK